MLSYSPSPTGQYAMTMASARLGDRVPSGCLSITSRIRVPLLAVGWLSSFCSVRSSGSVLGRLMRLSWSNAMGLRPRIAMALHRPVANALTTREVLGPPDRNPRPMHLDQRLLDRTLSPAVAWRSGRSAEGRKFYSKIDDRIFNRRSRKAKRRGSLRSKSSHQETSTNCVHKTYHTRCACHT